MPAPSALERFLRLMETYNDAVWPLQLVAYALAITAVLLALKGSRRSSQAVLVIVALFWLWVGLVFNGMYLGAITRGAVVAAVVFVLQGVVLVRAAFSAGGLGFRARADAYGITGGALVLYATLGYPAVEYLLGRGFPRSLPFGLVPCPTTVFTLGVLLWSTTRVPRHVLAIPFLYSLGGVGPVSNGIVEDAGLVVAGVVSTGMILYRDHRQGGHVVHPSPQAAKGSR
ncbi:MAG: DUF6064 family protein [Thermoanaerobaculaceae bacterium]|nr:DUF6064 family protein [Thermoanaerobaculaceae bacterium]TAM45844.1 MAG: hypothetical protein EPN53_14205 [Acidobacteriota bacterium]